MNRIFRVIYNQTTQAWQAVSDIAKSHGKTKSSCDAKRKADSGYCSLKLLAIASLLTGVQSANAAIYLPMGMHAENFVPSWLVGNGGYYGGNSGGYAPAPLNPTPTTNGTMMPSYGGNTAQSGAGYQPAITGGNIPASINPSPVPNGTLIPNVDGNTGVLPTTSLQPSISGSATSAPINNVSATSGAMIPVTGGTSVTGSTQPAPTVKFGSIGDLLAGKPSITIPTDQNGSVKLGTDLTNGSSSLGFSQNGSGFDLTGDPFGKGSLTGNISGNKVTVGADLDKGNATLGYDNKGNGISITNGIDGSGSITGSVLGGKVTVDSDGKVTSDLSKLNPLEPGPASNTLVINGIASALGGKPGVSIPVNGDVANGTLNASADAGKGTSSLGYDQNGNGVSLVSGTDGSNNINANYGGNKITVGSNGALSVETSDGKKYGFSTQKDKDGNNVGGMPNPLDTIKNGGLSGIVKLGHDTVNGVLGLTHIAGENTPNEVAPGAPDQNDPGSVVNGAFTPGPIPIPTFQPGNPAGATATNTTNTASTSSQPTATVNNVASQPSTTNVAGQPTMTAANGGATVSGSVTQPSVSVPVNGDANNGAFKVGADVNKGTASLGYDQNGNGVDLVSGTDGSNNINAHYGGNKITVGSNGALSVETSDGKKYGFSTQKDKDGNNVGGMPNPLDTIKNGGLSGIVKLGHDTVNGVLGLTHIAGEETPNEVAPGAPDQNDPGSVVNGAFTPGPIPIPTFQPGNPAGVTATTNDTNTQPVAQPSNVANIPGQPVMTPAPATVQNPSMVPGVGPVPSSPMNGAPLSPTIVGPQAYGGTGYMNLFAMPDNFAGSDADPVAAVPSVPTISTYAAPEESAVSKNSASPSPIMNLMALPDNPKWPPFTEEPQPIVLAALPVDPAQAVQPQNNDVVYLGDANNLKGGELRYHRYPGAPKNQPGTGEWQMYDPRYKDDTHDGWVEIKWRDGFGYFVSGRDNEQYCQGAGDFNGCSTPYYFYPQGGEGDGLESFSHTVNRDPNSKVVVDKNNNNINFNAGNGVTAFRDQDGSVDIVANVDNDTIVIDDQGRLKANIPAGQEAAPWNFQVNGEKGGSVAPGGDLNFTSENKTVAIKPSEDGKAIDFGVKVDGSTITVGDDGTLSAVIPEGKAGWDGFTANINGEAGPVVNQENPNLNFVDGEGTTVTNADGSLAYNVKNAGVSIGDDGKAAEPQDPEGFVKGKDFTDTVNSLAWSNTVNGEDSRAVKAGDTVDFADGKGTTAGRNENGSITFDANVDGETITFDDQGRLKANIPAAQEGAGWNAVIGSNEPVAVKDGDAVKFVDGNVTAVSGSPDEGIKYDVKIDNDTITVDDQGRLKANVPAAKEAAPWNFKVNGAEGGAVAPGGDLDYLSSDKSVNIAATEDGKGIDFGVNVDGSTIKIGDDGKLTAVIPEAKDGWDGFTAYINGQAGPVVNQENPKLNFVDGEGTTVTNTESGIAYNVVKAGVNVNSDGKLAAPANPAGFVDGANFVDTVNKLGWNAQVKTDDPTHVGFGDTVKFLDGSGTTVTGDATNGIQWNAKIDGKTIKLNDKGELTAVFLTDAPADSKTNISSNTRRRGTTTPVTTFAAYSQPFDGDFSSASDTATYAGVNEIDDLQNQVQDLKEAGFGLKDQDGNEFHQELGTTAAIIGDENKNIATKVVDQQDGTKAISVQLANDLHLVDGKEKSQWNAYGIGFAGDNGNKTAIAANTIALGDRDENKLTATSQGLGIADSSGNTNAFTATGVVVEDQHGNMAELSQTGIGFKQANGEAVTLGVNGLSNGGNKATGIAAGEVSANSTDAVNGSQLFSTNQKLDTLVDNIKQGPNAVIKGMDFGGDTGRDFNSQLGSKVTVTGGVNNPEELTYGNLGVVSDGQSTLVLGLSQNLRGLNSVQTGATTVSNAGVVIQSPMPANSANVVSLTASGLNNGGNRITNVAPGINGTDAANINQLNTLGQQVTNMGTQLNQTIYDLRNDMSSDMRRIENNSRAGTASALAQGGLPTASMPNEKLVTIGGGVYHGEAGYAVGISTVSPNGKWILKGTATGDSRNNYGGSGAIGYRWF